MDLFSFAAPLFYDKMGSFEQSIRGLCDLNLFEVTI